MDKKLAMQLIKTHRIAAVIRLDDLSHAQALCEALLDGGIRVLEFTLTNPNAIDVVSTIRQQLSIFDSGEAVIGVGSIRSAKDAQRAVDAGAQLLVSPTLLLDMINVAGNHAITAVAGYTPTEIERGSQAGADMVKVFPANTLGAGYIKSLLAPMPELSLMPTGGITINNIKDYLNAGAIAVGIGGSLLNKQDIADKNWQAISDNARQYVDIISEV